MKTKKATLASLGSTVALFILLPLATLLIRGFLVSNGLMAGDNQDEVAANNAINAGTAVPMVPPDWHLINDRFRLLNRTDIARAIHQWWLDDSQIVALQIASTPLEFAFLVDGQQQEAWRRVDFEETLGEPTGGERGAIPYQVTIRTTWEMTNPESHPILIARIMTETTDVTTGFKRQIEVVETIEANVNVPPKEMQRTDTGEDRALRTIDFSFPSQKSDALNAQINDAFVEETAALGYFRLWRATFNQGGGNKERQVELVVRPHLGS